MPIPVTCPKCLKRFNVADQHAGKQGPCPNCKTKITIPKKEDAVVIHAPDPTTSGPVDSKGRSVLKTTRRKDSKFSPVLAISASGIALLAILGAYLLGTSELLKETTFQSLGILGVGAALLGPLLAWSGYQFLRDDELEPYRGTELWLRALAAGVVYAGLWFLYGYLITQFFDPDDIAKGLDWWYPVVFLAVIIAAGILVAYVAFDLEPLSAGMHFGLFLFVTVILRAIMGLQFVPGLGS